MASFKHQNLMQDLSPLGRFEIVFCRNVAIYFTDPDKISLFRRIERALEPDGYLVVGAMESLTGLCPQFESQTPSTIRVLPGEDLDCQSVKHRMDSILQHSSSLPTSDERVASSQGLNRPARHPRGTGAVAVVVCRGQQGESGGGTGNSGESWLSSRRRRRRQGRVRRSWAKGLRSGVDGLSDAGDGWVRGCAADSPARYRGTQSRHSDHCRDGPRHGRRSRTLPGRRHERLHF